MPKQKRIRGGRRISYIRKRIKGAFTDLQRNTGAETVGDDYRVSPTVASLWAEQILHAWEAWRDYRATGDPIALLGKQSKKPLPVKLKAGRIGGKKK